jgi:lipid-A-disaccharide synthase
MTRRVFITVAEVSGDKHAAQLIRSLRQIDPSLLIEGFGGPEMAAAGAIVHRDTVTRAAMGWRGILRAREVLNALKWTRRYFADNRPNLHIGVDSPSMNFHFARVAHERGIPVLQYVAPQLWAWAQWRMKKLRKWVDHVACILPFEEAYFRRHGVNASFVGHPLFDELPPQGSRDARNRSADQAPVIGLLAGSRRAEARANFPGLLNAAAQIRRAFPDAAFLAPTTPATQPIVQSLISAHGMSGIEPGVNCFDHMVSHCDLCLTVSGTATLHVAALGVPMIVVYRINPIAWNAAARWIVPTRTFALVNLLAEDPTRDRGAAVRPVEHLVPEFIPWYGAGDPIARLAIDYLNHPEKLAGQRERLEQLVRNLDHPGASDKTAALAMEMMNHPAAPHRGDII